MVPHRFRFVGSSASGLYIGLLALVSVYLILAMLYLSYTPAWQNPDEPAHYNYTRQISETASIPVLQPSDYNQQYLADIVARRFPRNFLQNHYGTRVINHHCTIFYRCRYTEVPMVA